MARFDQRGFTLVELMIVVAIIGILAAIAIPQYGLLVEKSKEGSTRGNLGTLRSALSIYYGDNDEVYPSDDLSSLTVESRYLPLFPVAKMPPFHGDTVVVTTEDPPSEVGTWSYDNVPTSASWGKIHVGCLHSDHSGTLWSSY